uniref:Uncharacterized protein n=1 Tax=Anguilla anguilla TaxID=7936 RepID=A0A0E9XQW2_ANGAN
MKFAQRGNSALHRAP